MPKDTGDQERVPRNATADPENWPALNVKMHALASLHPDPDNPRKHDEKQIGQIADSMNEFGWTLPILADESGAIIVGEARWQAALLLGRTEGPVAICTGWSPEQVQAYRVADNRLAENSNWDDQILRLTVQALGAMDFNLGLLGFTEAELKVLLAPEPEGLDSGAMLRRFGGVPFSVLNAREGWWQDRKRAWIALGIQSELGRGAAPGGSPMPLDRQKNESTLGAIAPNEGTILKRTGKYAAKKR